MLLEHGRKVVGLMRDGILQVLCNEKKSFHDEDKGNSPFFGRHFCIHTIASLGVETQSPSYHVAIPSTITK